MLWRLAEGMILVLVMALIPLFNLLRTPYELYLPVYAGVLCAMFYCNQRRLTCREQARRLHEEIC